MLFEEFHAHAFPSPFWTLASFLAYIRRMQWSFDARDWPLAREDEERLFRSFLPYSQSYLGFADFVMGIACLTPRVKHASHAGFFRLERILRFYDDDRRGSLSPDQMYDLRRDLRRVAGIRRGVKGRGGSQRTQVEGPWLSQEQEDQEMEEQLTQDYAAVGVDVSNIAREDDLPRVTLPQLAAAVSKVSQAGLRGTSALLRFSFSFFARRIYAGTASAEAAAQRCSRHRLQESYLTPYHVCLNGSACISRTILDRRLSSSKTDGEETQALDPLTPAVQVIRLVHAMAARLRNRVEGLTSGTCNVVENDSDWRCVSAAEQRRRINLMTQVCAQARRLFLAEERIARLASPVLVFGDTHGNLADVLTFEAQFWRRSPLMPVSLLLLGDYVDRGMQSLEVFLYFLALKCLSPSCVSLLRGNHETRSMHLSFTFRREVLSKCDAGMYDACCSVMDVMPVAAVIDERLFCAHGGLPLDEMSVTVLRRTLPPVMNDVEEQSSPAWQALWNDPLDPVDLEPEARGANSDPDAEPMTLDASALAATGFAANVKRGTGYVYSGAALSRFNHLNDTSHLIRGHELVMQGFKLHFGGRAFTVFSTSSYVGESNTAACILVQDSLLIPIQVTTSPPPPEESENSSI